MTRHLACAALAIALVTGIPSRGAAQHGAPAAPVATKAPPEAAQFDFLVGHWELVVTPAARGLAARLHGVPKLSGVWKAWRAFDGWGIEDELRIVDASGNPVAYSHFVRAFNAAAKSWIVTALDVYRSRFTPSTAKWQQNEMHITGEGTEPDGRSYVSRVRFRRISATAFQYVQDRSYDGGKTWEDATLTIDAKRLAALAPR